MSAAEPTPGAALFVRDVEIVNTRGLHARASAKFVQTAEKFEADIRVSRDGQTVPGTSIMGLMMLAAAPGCCIRIETEGAEAEAALEALAALVADGFGERD
ncbi:HPr family phosphocarrier protein [Parvibaculum sp.]|uniref:HPr family phosphocarrier protein n=1 Tax=Parvibaculum sp. TaxID=2024848 RepID=UPI0039191574